MSYHHTQYGERGRLTEQFRREQHGFHPVGLEEDDVQVGPGLQSRNVLPRNRAQIAPRLVGSDIITRPGVLIRPVHVRPVRKPTISSRPSIQTASAPRPGAYRGVPGPRPLSPRDRLVRVTRKPVPAPPAEETLSTEPLVEPPAPGGAGGAAGGGWWSDDYLDQLVDLPAVTDDVTDAAAELEKAAETLAPAAKKAAASISRKTWFILGGVAVGLYLLTRK
jgi:hypothetical protein